MTVIVQLAGLTAVYAFATFGLFTVLRRVRQASPRAMLLSFAVFGLASGLAAVWLWPLETIVLSNVYGVIAGDWAYNTAISWLGDPYSANAHSTIPWPLRVPQVYVLSSLSVCTAAGAIAQWLYDRLRDEFAH